MAAVAAALDTGLDDNGDGAALDPLDRGIAAHEIADIDRAMEGRLRKIYSDPISLIGDELIISMSNKEKGSFTLVDLPEAKE